MNTQKKIQVCFQVDTKNGRFQDALYFTEDEFNNLAVGEIETIAQKRADDWVYLLNNPPVVPEPTKEELQAEADAITQQIQELQNKKLELDNKIQLIEII